MKYISFISFLLIKSYLNRKPVQTFNAIFAKVSDDMGQQIQISASQTPMKLLLNVKNY